MLVDTINKVKAISFDSSNLNDYVASLRGLSAAQQRVVLSSAGIDKAQKQQILNKLAETSATTTLTAAQAVEISQRTLGTDVDAKALLSKAGLVTEKQLLTGATITLTASEIDELVAKKAITAADGAKIKSALGLKASNIGLAGTFKLLALSIWESVKAIGAFLLTNPAGWAILAVGAITGAFALINSAHDSKTDNLIKNTQREIEELDKEISKHEEEIDVLESLREKLIEAEGDKSKLAAIQGELNKRLTETPLLLEGETEAYNKSRAELEALIETEKEYLKTAQKDKADKSKLLFDNKTIKRKGLFGADGLAKDKTGTQVRNLLKTVFDTTGEFYDPSKGLSKDLVIGTGITSGEINKFLSEQVELIDEAFAYEIDQYSGFAGESFVKNIITQFLYAGKDSSEITEALGAIFDDGKTKELINNYWESLLDPNIDSDAAFDKVQDAFGTLAIQYPELKALLEKHLEQVRSGGKTYVDTYKGLEDSINSLSSALASAKNAYELLNEVEKDFNSTGAISIENIQKLLGKFPDLEDELYEYIMGMRSGASVIDLIKTKTDDMATMSEAAFKRMYLSSSSVSKDMVSDYVSAFDIIGLTWDDTQSVMGNINLKIIDANGVVCSTFIDQWDEACKSAGERVELFAQAYYALMTGDFYTPEKGYGIYQGDNNSGFFNKSPSGETTNITDVLAWSKLYEQGITSTTFDPAKDGEAYRKAYNEAFNEQKKIYDNSWKNNAETERLRQEATERIKQYAQNSDDKSGSDKNEVLDNYLKDAENRYKIHQNETKYIEELQWAYDTLTKTEKERLDITGKINEAYRDLADNRINDIEHQIDLAKELHGDDVDVTGYYDKIQQIAHKEANRYREFARKELGYYDEGVTDERRAEIDSDIEKTKEIQELQKTWWDAENSKLDFYSKQHENLIRDIEFARDMALESNPFADTTSYYKQLQDAYHQEAERLRALDPEKYKEEIRELQENWIDAQKSIVDWSYSNSERWISDRNTYNDWELYGDNEVAAWERVLKRFQTEYPNELEKIKEIEENIFNARKEAMDKSIEDIEDYIDARNTYNDWDAYGDSEVRAIERQTKIIQDEYKQRLISREEYIKKLEEQSERIYSLAQEEIDKNLSNIDKYIDARNHYNDWDEFGDSEIDAIKRQIQYLDAAYNQKLISYEDYTERVAEYTQKMYSVAKDNIIKEVSELIEDYEEMKGLESSQLNSQKTLLQSYYDVTNAIAEVQHEINKELEASMSMYEYLNEDTRELLFNQEDYEVLSKELLDIQTAANELQKQYQEDILNANAETIAEITSQYEMQYSTMMKQYEIAKAELEVAKKRQKLDNVLAERNTRMFINGQWQWVAKTQDVINAQNELADAEIERKKQEASLEQTEAINDFTAQINSLETDLNKTKKWWSDMQEMLDGESEEVAEALRQISNVSSPELKRVIQATGGSIGSFSGFLSDSTSTMSEVINSNLSGITYGVSGFITNLTTYSNAILNMAARISGVQTSDSPTSVGNTYKVNPDGKAPSGLKVGDKVVTAGGTYEIIGVNSDGSYDSYLVDSNTTTSNYKGSYANVSSGSSNSGSSSSSSSGSSSSSSSSSKQVNTTDQYVNSGGVIQSNPNWDGKKKGGVGSFYKYAVGTRYTAGGLTALGEEGFEAYITNNGRLIPITQPTIGNIGAGGIVFNREQMAGLRTLWDWSNLSKVSPFVSSSNANNQSTVIDNSIHINGLTVGEQGNEDWINGLRRYVATHK